LAAAAGNKQLSPDKEVLQRQVVGGEVPGVHARFPDDRILRVGTKHDVWGNGFTRNPARCERALPGRMAWGIA